MGGEAGQGMAAGIRVVGRGVGTGGMQANTWWAGKKYSTDLKSMAL